MLLSPSPEKASRQSMKAAIPIHWGKGDRQ
jgi:hypothetical protein